MNARQNWVLAVAIVLASLILGVSLGGRSAAQPKAEGAAGRYQAVRGFTNAGYFVLVDSDTGHCWQNLAGPGGQNWVDLGNPAQK